jgi:hypothetical protein
VHCGLPGVPLCLEFHANKGDILGGFVFGVLDVLLAFGFDSGDVEGSFVTRSLELLVTVISDSCEVHVEILEGGDASVTA